MTFGSVFDDLKPGSANVELAHDAAVTKEAKTHLGVIEWKATSSSLMPEVAKLLDSPCRPCPCASGRRPAKSPPRWRSAPVA